MSRVAPYLDQPDLDPTIGGAKTTPPPVSAEDEPVSRLQLMLTGLQERLKTAEKLVGQLGEFLGHLMRVKIDKAMLAIRTALIWAMVGVAAGVMGVAAIVYATVLVLSGISGGLGALFGRPWLGELLTGLIVVTAILVTTMVVARSLIGKGEKALHAKYDAIKAAQREKFGRDVDAAAAGSAP